MRGEDALSSQMDPFMITLPPLLALTSGPFTRSSPTSALVTSWQDTLHALMEEIGPRFARSEVRRHARAYVSGLLSPVERKNSWHIAAYGGDQTPSALQHLLGRALWDADAVRDDLQTYVQRHLADPEASLIIDETSFLKQGHHSVGVGSQDSGITGHSENAQVGVFLLYATTQGSCVGRLAHPQGRNEVESVRMAQSLKVRDALQLSETDEPNGQHRQPQRCSPYPTNGKGVVSRHLAGGLLYPA